MLTPISSFSLNNLTSYYHLLRTYPNNSTDLYPHLNNVFHRLQRFPKLKHYYHYFYYYYHSFVHLLPRLLSSSQIIQESCSSAHR